MGGKKKYINIFGSFTEPFNYIEFMLKVKYKWQSHKITVCNGTR